VSSSTPMMFLDTTETSTRKYLASRKKKTMVQNYSHKQIEYHKHAAAVPKLFFTTLCCCL
jgi:hypothetical protein